MIQQAIQYIADQATAKANEKRATLFAVPGDGRKVVIEHNGTLVDRDVPPPLRSHAVSSVDDLITAANKWNTAPVIWINDQTIVLVIDDADRRETVSLTLIYSAVFQAVAKLETNSWLDQPTLIRLLRRELRGANGAAALLASVRKISFKQHASGHANIQHGSESMGQSVENEVTGAGDLAESLTIPVNVFANPGEDAKDKAVVIGLDIDVDAKQQKFRLQPLPDEINLAKTTALAGIRTTIAKALPKVTVLFGKP